jgi:hypothetical protein
MLSDNGEETSDFSSGDCCYYDLSTLPIGILTNSILHMNVRSLQHKLDEVEALVTLFKYPKVIVLTETWLKPDSVLVPISNYCFVSSPCIVGRGGGVAVYLHNDVHYRVTDRSNNQNSTHNIDYLLVEPQQLGIALCCMYCPPKSKLTDISHIITKLKEQVNNKFCFVAAGDFNINLLNDSTNLSNDFLDELHALSLHPTVSLPTRVTDNSATLIDNFMCDFNLIPAQTCVVKIDLSDHYLITLVLPNNNNTNVPIKTRNFSCANKIEFARRLQATNWDYLYTLTDVDKAFGYFLKKIKRIYNKCFTYILVKYSNRKSPWLTNGILKSIRYKNRLYTKLKANPELKPTYVNYKNRLCKIIRFAKQEYYKNILSAYKNNSAKLWAHLKSIIKPQEKNLIPINSNTLNDFFTSVFNQAPAPKNDDVNTVPTKNFVTNSFFLTPVASSEIICTVNSLSNSKAVGCDGINPMIIKNNISSIANPLVFIANLSFSKGVFPKLLKNAIVTPVFKSGSTSEPSNYRPISILSIFSKLLEKLFYSRIITFINKHTP